MPRRVFLLPVLALCFAGACRQRDDAPFARVMHGDVALPSQIQRIEARVPRNATLETLLRNNKLASQFTDAAVASARLVFNPRSLRADRPYYLVLGIDGALREFVYEIDTDRFLRIISKDEKRPELLNAEVVPFEKQVQETAVRGSIDGSHPSLISAMEATGENIQLALTIAEMFGGSIDFDNDLQPGDSFDAVFEKSTRDGQFAGYGPVSAARFVNNGHTFQAYRWTDPATGKSAYYDENGRSLKRFFLKSPLKFEFRVTSGFSLARVHPVFHDVRAHLGVDYGAPYGSAVVAVASGIVESAGWAGGGGNQVRIRHASGYESYYLHLSSFGAGIHAGARVDQGQVIGKVGMTGTATGPHLDYRLRKNGVFVNPRIEHSRLPPGEPIPTTELAAFRAARDGALRRFSVSALAEGPRQKLDAVKAAR
jgi:murein DD-endopeptidase MepM/ murein hydrolase activator NlpD